MLMKKLTIFEPAMCCETGVCGVDADQTLINFTADIEWLRKQGASIQRFNLAQEPAAFISDPVVKSEIKQHQESCLPLLIVAGSVVSRGTYPDRITLQGMTGTELAGNPVKDIDHDGSTKSCGCSAGTNC
jgi:hypothetical protein